MVTTASTSVAHLSHTVTMSATLAERLTPSTYERLEGDPTDSDVSPSCARRTSTSDIADACPWEATGGLVIYGGKGG